MCIFFDVEIAVDEQYAEQRAEVRGVQRLVRQVAVVAALQG